MRGATDWLTTRNDDFFNKQRAYLERVIANKVAWGIPDAAITPLTTLQTEYEPLYWKIQDKRARTSGDVTAHRDCRDRFETELRAFHKERVIGNRSIPKSELSILVGKERDTVPTPRGKIDTIPIIGLIGIGGGDIEVRARVTTDQTRFSMHPLADAVECRYTLVPKGDMPPEGQKDTKKSQVSKKARFIISLGDEQAGESFYGFFRWVNLTNPANSGAWSKAQKVVIA
ncbi:MAG: hypothetical protein WC980_03120 [Candidatus Brocadiia bacterium]